MDLEGTALFRIVEIEINTSCNRRCVYCPNRDYDRTPRFMHSAAFGSIVDKLRSVGFSGRLSYHLYNEPLLHPMLNHFVAIAARILPAATQVVFTNGDLLTDDAYDSLLRAGVSHFYVTAHDRVAPPVREKQNCVFPEEVRLTNRGGALDPAADCLYHVPCLAPSEMLIIDIDGDVLLCYEDYFKSCIMGNVFRESLYDVWFGERFSVLRALLAGGQRQQGPTICQLCNSKNHLEYEDLSIVTRLGRTHLSG